MSRQKDNQGVGSRIGRWAAEIVLLEIARRVIRKIVRRI